MPSTILDEDEIQHLRNNYMSDNTAYMRWSTEIEPKKDMMDSDFIKRNRNLLMFADKFAPLANFTDGRSGILHKLKLDDLELEESLGLHNFAEKTVIGAIDDIQLSRGNEGFFQRAIITQRHELTEKRTTDVEKKVGFFNKLFGGKKQESQESELQ